MMILARSAADADLRGADLRDAILERADLTGVIQDDATQWPTIFTPAPRRVVSPQQRSRQPNFTVVGCSDDEISIFIQANPVSDEMIVLGIYEPAQEASASSPPAPVAVRIQRATLLILVPSSARPVHWVVEAAPQARIERIIINAGEGGGRISAVPRRVEVVEMDPRRAFASTPHEWPGEDGETRHLVMALRALTTRDVTAFAGCYQGASFTIQDARR